MHPCLEQKYVDSHGMLTEGDCTSAPNVVNLELSIVANAGVSVSPMGSPGIPLLRRRRCCVIVVVVVVFVDVALVIPLDVL